MTKHTFEVGDVVSLLDSETHVKLTQVKALLDTDGALKLEDELDGTKYWNEDALVNHAGLSFVDFEAWNAIVVLEETVTNHPILGDETLRTFRTTDGKEHQGSIEAHGHQKILVLANQYESLREDDKLCGDGGQCQDVGGGTLIEFIQKNQDWIKSVLDLS